MSSKRWHTDRCWFAGTGRGECDGPLQRAHLLPKQRLRREGITEFAELWHRDVLLILCERHHRRLDARLERLPREQLPGGVFMYAERHGLGWMLDREFPV